jgi:hypothetical protein
MKTRAKSVRTKSRVINKSIDQRFRMRTQRGPISETDRSEKSTMDIPDTKRRRRQRGAVRRLQLGRTLSQSELAARDPVRD